jgi:MoaA/NifB/PqqE/SkfB family radical SAM enzyme
MAADRLSFKDRFDLHLLNKQKKKLIREHHLDYLVWECTLRSNLMCNNCNVTCDQDEHAHTDMPLSNFFNLIDSLPQEFIHRSDGGSMQVMITGGEPLIRTDLEECGRELSRRRIGWGLATNALGMTRTRLENFIRSSMTFIKIEVNTPLLTQNSIKAEEDSYENVLSTLSYVSKELGLESEATTYISAENVDHLSEIKDILIAQGVKKWRLFSKLDVLGMNCDRSLLLNKKQVEEILDFVNEVRAENKVNVVFACDNLMGGYEKKVHKDFFFCKAGVSMATLFVDGVIGVCLLNRDENCLLGNIYKDDFYEVWNNRFNSFLNKEWTEYRCELHCSFNRYCKGKHQVNQNSDHGLGTDNISVGEASAALKCAL